MSRKTDRGGGARRVLGEAPRLEKVAHDEVSIRRLVSRLGEPSRLRVCYEAGPTGYELYRLFASMRVPCEVVAPSLVPVAPGEKVKTDRRDARRLVRLYRGVSSSPCGSRPGRRKAVGTSVGCGARRCSTAVAPVSVSGRCCYAATWCISTGRPGHSSTGVGCVRCRSTTQEPGRRSRISSPASKNTKLRVTAIEADLAGFFARGLFVDEVARLAAYRGIDQLSALAMAAEVCDWRRFPAPTKFMGFVGLVPSEYSTGASTRRYGITKAGNAHVRRARRSRVGLPISRPGQPRTGPPPPRTPSRSRCPLLGMPGPAVWTVPSTRRTQRPHHRRGHRGCPRTRRVRVGRDDRLTIMTARSLLADRLEETHALRSQDASATAFAGTEPRVILRTTVLGRSPARTVWGNRLRMNTLRFRPTHVRVAASRSTWCRRVLHHPPRPPPPLTGSRVAAATFA